MAQAVSEPLPVEAKPRRWRPNMRLWGPIGLLIAGSAVYSAICEWRDSHGLLINTSESLPNWAFVIHKTARPERGQYVFFVPPAHPLVVRHFGAKKQMFGKIVYGMPGDIVSHRGAEVLVNGKVVARMKPRTRFDEPLAAGPVGVIPPQCYFVGTPHKDGFDSRYAAIGYACAKNIVGVGEAIL
jgi:conjugal transfer pilin signal peptidase TrbI